jgi:hypothetical protein
MTKITLSLRDILEMALNNPNGTQLTSKVEERIDKNGNKVKEFKILA